MVFFVNLWLNHSATQPLQEVGVILKPLRKHSLYEGVAGQILRLIREGHFRPGDQLPGERELAEMLGVNRGTVREALRVLEFMRVLKKRAGEGVFVADPVPNLGAEALVFHFLVEDGLDEASLRSAFEAVTCIEASMARLAALRAGEEDLAALESLISRMEEGAGEGRGFTALDEKFHLAVGRASRSEVLYSIDITMWVIMRRYAELLHREPACRQWCLEGHRRIAAAISARDGDLAAREMENHLKGAYRMLFA